MSSEIYSNLSGNLLKNFFHFIHLIIMICFQVTQSYAVISMFLTNNSPDLYVHRIISFVSVLFGNTRTQYNIDGLLVSLYVHRIISFVSVLFGNTRTQYNIDCLSVSLYVHRIISFVSVLFGNTRTQYNVDGLSVSVCLCVCVCQCCIVCEYYQRAR